MSTLTERYSDFAKQVNQQIVQEKANKHNTDITKSFVDNHISQFKSFIQNANLNKAYFEKYIALKDETIAWKAVENGVFNTKNDFLYILAEAQKDAQKAEYQSQTQNNPELRVAYNNIRQNSKAFYQAYNLTDEQKEFFKASNKAFVHGEIDIIELNKRKQAIINHPSEERKLKIEIYEAFDNVLKEAKQYGEQMTKELREKNIIPENMFVTYATKDKDNRYSTKEALKLFNTTRKGVINAIIKGDLSKDGAMNIVKMQSTILKNNIDNQVAVYQQRYKNFHDRKKEHEIGNAFHEYIEKCFRRISKSQEIFKQVTQGGKETREKYNDRLNHTIKITQQKITTPEKLVDVLSKFVDSKTKEFNLQNTDKNIETIKAQIADIKLIAQSDDKTSQQDFNKSQNQTDTVAETTTRRKQK